MVRIFLVLILSLVTTLSMPAPAALASVPLLIKEHDPSAMQEQDGQPFRICVIFDDKIVVRDIGIINLVRTIPISIGGGGDIQRYLASARAGKFIEGSIDPGVTEKTYYGLIDQDWFRKTGNLSTDTYLKSVGSRMGLNESPATKFLVGLLDTECPF